MSKTLLACRQIFFGKVIKTAFYVSIRTIWGKKSVFNLFCMVFAQWANKFRFFLDFFLTRLSRLHSICPYEHFEEKKFHHIFYPFRTMSEQFSAFSRNFSDRIVENAFYTSGGTFWNKNTFYWSNFAFSSFPDIEQTLFGWLAKSFSQGYQNCSLRVHRIHLMRNATFLKNIFSHFGTLNKMFSACCQKFFGRVTENCILRVHGKTL